MLSGANNSFACDLYHQLAQENSGDNAFFSPYSLFSVLAMCAEGARGATAEELGNVLRLPAELRRGDQDAGNTPWNLEPLHEGVSVLNSLMSSDKDREAIAAEVKESRLRLWGLSKRADEAKKDGNQKEILAIVEETREEEARFKLVKARSDPNVIRAANSLWGEQTCPFRHEFVEVIERHYHTGGVSPVDFKRDATGAEQMINDWVEKQTNGRIKDLIPPGCLSDLTRLVLANAIYFKGTWAAPFSEEETRPLPFTSPGGTVREVPTMIATHKCHASYAAFNSDGSFFRTPREIPIESAVAPAIAITKDPVGGPEYPEADGFAMLEMPYQGRRLSMILIAPNHHDGLATLERGLSGELLMRWVEQLCEREPHVLVPRFKFDTGYQLADTFGALGLKHAFENPLHVDGADFRGMTSSDEPDDQLFIAEIFHKAFVDVNEMGTEAAAASAAVMLAGAIMKPVTVPFTPVFKADSPFICIIRDRTTGAILFMGRVAAPR